jgi:hypothetical protein
LLLHNNKATAYKNFNYEFENNNKFTSMTARSIAAIIPSKIKN